MCVISKPISHQELETIAIVASSLTTTVVNDEIAKKGSNRTGTTTIKRQRVEVEDIFDKLGLTHSRRAYRMRTDSFYMIYEYLSLGLTFESFSTYIFNSLVSSFGMLLAALIGLVTDVASESDMIFHLTPEK